MVQLRYRGGFETKSEALVVVKFDQRQGSFDGGERSRRRRHRPTAGVLRCSISQVVARLRDQCRHDCRWAARLPRCSNGTPPSESKLWLREENNAAEVIPMRMTDDDVRDFFRPDAGELDCFVGASVFRR